VNFDFRCHSAFSFDGREIVCNFSLQTQQKRIFRVVKDPWRSTI
jgi:hypothetical protein